MNLRQMLFFPVLAALISTACTEGDRRAADDAGPRDSYNARAWVLRDEGAPADSFIGMQRKAVELVREGRSTDDPVEVLAQMGFFYCNICDYVKGIDYLLEAADTLESRPDLAAGEGAVQLYGNLGMLYLTLGLEKESLEMNARGIELSRRNLGGRLLSDLYKMRARAFDYADMPDSAMACYGMALRAIDDSDTNRDKDELRMLVKAARAGYMVDNIDLYRDSLPSIISVLEQAVAADDSADDTDRRMSLGSAYVQAGRGSEGIRLLNDAYDEYRRQEDLTGVSYALDALMGAYATLNLGDSMLSIWPAYRESTDSLLSETEAQAVISADVRYRATEKEAANRLLDAELRTARQRLELLWLGIALAVLAAALLVVLLVYRTREAGRQKQLHGNEMARMLEYQQELNGRIEKLDERLAVASNESAVAEVRELLCPAMLNGDNERKFRQAFSAVYPHFLPDLRRDFAGLTGNDELVCMLIFIHQNTDEVSLTLGISRASVNSARYRLRKKLGLGRETDLDAFLRAR